MDVHCSTCKEPWDTYHLRHDAIYECGSSELANEYLVRNWKMMNQDGLNPLTPDARAALKEQGWEFGVTVMNVRHCPCCPKGAVIDKEADAAKQGIESTLGDDLDGAAAIMEDFGL